MSNRWASLVTNGLGRAQRFAIPMSIQFRTLDDTDWLEGAAENVSRSGILFHAPQLLDVHTPVEIRFEWPSDMVGGVSTQVICAAEIVRVVEAPSSDGPPLLAAKILDYHFVRSAESRS